jgi:xanthine dehydrogenase molybdenum-binding subunit
MERRKISLYVNGIPYEIDIPPKKTLLRVLRDDLHLTGTKEGCGHGMCGACTVIVEGVAVRSCVYLAHRADGKRVETIEGLAKDGELHPLQRAFIEQGAIQCGFCTPGMIMAAKALLDSNPNPTRDEIIEALRFNLCRCTGYVKIIEAIEVARGKLRGERGSEGGVGLSLPRPDARAKATGEAVFAADIYFEGMLHAKVLRSLYPHAKLIRIDTSKAKRLPGVAAVLTADDIPGEKNHGVVRSDWPVLAYDKVRYIGDAVAIVAAETEDIAEEALKLIEVEYEPLPVVDSPEVAISPNAPLVHDGGNLLKHIEVRKGDVEEGFALSDVIIERTYRTVAAEHAFLEPEAGVARVEEDGKITIYVGSQIPFEDRRQIASSLAIPEEKVRVVHTCVGGAFGGKEDISTQIHVALLAQATGKPVKLVYTRRESMISSTKRHPTIIRMKTGATKEGKLLAVEAEILGDAGAYASLSEHVMTRTATHSTGPYEVPNVKIDCYALYTNNPPSGAFRGFGVPQAHFAAESQMDILAERLGISPFEIRRRNALGVGSVTATGQVLKESVGLLETIERVKEQVESFTKSPSSEMNVISGEKRRGWGAACAYKNVGLGGGAPDCAWAEVEVLEGGKAVIRAGAAEVGQGLVGVLAQIVSEEIGIACDKIEVILGDTDLTLDSGPTTASRQTFITGNAVRIAAIKVRGSLAGAASEELESPPDTLTFRGGRIFRPDGLSIPLDEAIYLAKREGRPLSFSHLYTPPRTSPLGKLGDMHFAYGYATQAAEVEVDIKTGEVKVLRVVAAHDVGKAINPMAVEGQIEGGVMMGLGFALLEEFEIEGGIVRSDSFLKYKLPRIWHTPEIVPILVEQETSHGPYGAKGVGEITSIPTAPAIINAIYNACGIRIDKPPTTPAKILSAIKRLDVKGGGLR